MANSWKEKLRQRYGRAVEKSTHRAIAKAIKVNDGKLRSFLSKGYLSDEDCVTLEKYLDSLEAENTATVPPSAITLVARRLRDIADILEAEDLSPETKGKFFESFMDTFIFSRDEMIGLIKKSSKQ